MEAPRAGAKASITGNVAVVDNLLRVAAMFFALYQPLQVRRGPSGAPQGARDPLTGGGKPALSLLRGGGLG